jgi:hypothetical protein
MCFSETVANCEDPSIARRRLSGRKKEKLTSSFQNIKQYVIMLLKSELIFLEINQKVHSCNLIW